MVDGVGNLFPLSGVPLQHLGMELRGAAGKYLECMAKKRIMF